MNIRLVAIVSVLFHAYLGVRRLAGNVWAFGDSATLLVSSALVMPLGLGLGMRSSHGPRPLRTVLLNEQVVLHTHQADRPPAWCWPE